MFFIADPYPFQRNACRKGTEPLRKGVEIAITVDGTAATLRRTAQGTEIVEGAPSKPDMTFTLSQAALEQIAATSTEDVGEIGIAILHQMTHADAAMRLHAKVHIGPLDLLLKGYLGVLPLGGASLAKYLGSKGLTGVSKIKESIARLRD